MKRYLVMFAMLMCSGCASSQFNHHYASSSVPITTGYGLPESPHTF